MQNGKGKTKKRKNRKGVCQTEKKKKKVSQVDLVLNHLQTYRGITSYEAFEKYGITRLSAKIYDLRKKGYTIINRDREHVNRQGEKTHFVEYRLVKGQG